MKRFIASVIGIQGVTFRYSIWVASFFVTGATFSQATFATSGEKARELLEKAKITLGEYQWVDEKQPQKCLEGELKLVDLSESSSLLLGAHPLVLGLGMSKKAQFKEGKCQMRTHVELNGKKLVAHHQEKCGKQPEIQWQTEVEADKSTFTYRRQMISEGKEVGKVVCRLKLVKNASH